MKVCVLEPDYSTLSADNVYHVPTRDLSKLLPEATFTHVLLNKLTTYKQLKALSKQGFDVFVNLCESYLEWEVPSIDVIHSLELLNLPYTGPNLNLYDPTKELMKYVAYGEGIRTPAYSVVTALEDIDNVCKELQFPLFVKPVKAGDSLGIDAQSLVRNKEELTAKIVATISDYPELLVEEYIDGREFTVLVAANAAGGVTTFEPVEFVFPKGEIFKTYDLKSSEWDVESNVPVADAAVNAELRESAAKIFKAFNGVGYGRMDFRMDDKGQLYFLEVNFACSVFFTDGYEASADFILRYDKQGAAGFLKTIIAEGIARHQRKQRKYVVKGNAISGYGIYANKNLAKGEIFFKGEERSQRIATRSYVKQNWSAEEQENFRRYAYPLSSEVYVLWDNDPTGWSPQNHSCQPNTAFVGLDCVVMRPIKEGEELTLDYADFLDEEMEPFECHCGAPNCRGWVSGVPNNSVTKRELNRNLCLVSQP